MHAQSFLPKLKIHTMNGLGLRDWGQRVYHFNKDLNIHKNIHISEHTKHK